MIVQLACTWHTKILFISNFSLLQEQMRVFLEPFLSHMHSIKENNFQILYGQCKAAKYSHGTYNTAYQSDVNGASSCINLTLIIILKE
jgi:hypothetical protein